MMRRSILRLLPAAILFAVFFPWTASAEPTAVPASPEAICPLPMGSQVPDITLQDLQGREVDLRTAIHDKPTVLIYFRGGW